MDIPHSDLEQLLRQRILLKTFHGDPWLTIDQIYTEYTLMMRGERYLEAFVMSRDSMATVLSDWARNEKWLLRKKVKSHRYYRVNEVMDDASGCYVSLIYHGAMKIMGWKRNHNYAS